MNNPLLSALSVLAAAALVGCGSGEVCADGSAPVNDECPCADGTYPSDSPTGECDNTVECATGYSPTNDGECVDQCFDGTSATFPDVCPVPLNPVAVGFEYDGGWDGTDLTSFWLDAESEIPPGFLVIFADADYFGAASAEDQEGHFCEAWGEITGIYGQSVLATDDSGTIWHEFDMSWSINPLTWDNAQLDTACAFLLDEEAWGDGGEDLLAAFQDIHLGLGFGPMTAYLEDAWSEESIDLLGDSMFAQYIAINDASGDWIAYDWTTGILFEMNEDGTLATELNEDDEEVLIGVDLSAASSLPAGYIRSFAYWYQDFPLLDLSNLGDGAPTGN